MIRQKQQNLLRLSLYQRHNIRQFSSATEPEKMRKPIPTPEAGFRLPKEKDG